MALVPLTPLNDPRLAQSRGSGLAQLAGGIAPSQGGPSEASPEASGPGPTVSENIANAQTGPLGIPASALGLGALLGGHTVTPGNMGVVASLLGVPGLAAAPFSVTNAIGKGIGQFGDSLINAQQFDPADLQAIMNTPMSDLFSNSAFGGFGFGTAGVPGGIGAASPGFGQGLASLGTAFSMPSMGFPGAYSGQTGPEGGPPGAPPGEGPTGPQGGEPGAGGPASPGVGGPDSGTDGPSGDGEGDYSRGGLVPGVREPRVPGLPSGLDTLRIRAAPGEFVVNAPAVGHHLGMLQRWNRQAGGR